MAMLVDYVCQRCGALVERWVEAPIQNETSCAHCGARAGRRFGGSLLSGLAPRRPLSRTAGHQDGVQGPLPCVLIPTAVRMLTARIGGDERAVAREVAAQEAAIQEGTLKPDHLLAKGCGGSPTASEMPPLISSSDGCVSGTEPRSKQ